MNSPFQGAEIPGMGSMNDPLGFVKKLWGDMHLPGMVTPTVSIDELDKKIKDLQTVESWLTVNMNMLRGTIQALEVQRATISTLKSMGDSFAQQMKSASTSGGFAAEPKEEKSNAAWPMPAATPAAEKAPEPVKEVEPEPAKPAAKASAGSAAQAEPAAPFANPAAWWGLLQDQFKQAVSKAMEGDPTVAAAAVPGNKAKPEASVAKPRAAAGTAATTVNKTPAKSSAKVAPKTVAKKAAPKAAAKRAAPK